MTSTYRFIIIALILFSLFSVFVTTPSENSFRKKADEGYYFTFARLASDRGISEFPKLAETYINDINARIFPAPLRVGHILVTAFWFKIFGPTFTSLAWFSFLCFALFLAVSFYFAKRHFGEDVAYIFTLLLSSSPLMMGMGRRALSDMHGNFIMGITVWLFLDFLEDKNKLKYSILIVFLFWSVLVREYSLILVLFFTVFFFIYRYGYKKKLSYAYLFGLIALPSIMSVATYPIFFGGIPNTVNLLKSVLNTYAQPPDQYGYLFCTGPWFRYIVDFLLLTPITTLLCIGYFSHKLLKRAIEWKLMYFMVYFMIVFIVLDAITIFKIVRFVINLETVIALLATLFIFEIFSRVERGKRETLIFLAALAIFVINYRGFVDLFCFNDIYDPASYFLLVARKMIPNFF
jgi:4-amino-4-deoxy-L-arabinose transferase-like glycosyltransferase